MMGYTEFEAILARLFDVAESDMTAFRARLRHLRYQGVPDKPQLGSGRRLKYDATDLWECAVSLSLASYGLSPVRTVTVINRLRSEGVYRRVIEHDGDDLWLRVEIDGNVGRSTDDAMEILLGLELMTLDQVSEWFLRQRRQPEARHLHSFLEVSRFTRQIKG